MSRSGDPFSQGAWIDSQIDWQEQSNLKRRTEVRRVSSSAFSLKCNHANLFIKLSTGSFAVKVDDRNSHALWHSRLIRQEAAVAVMFNFRLFVLHQHRKLASIGGELQARSMPLNMKYCKAWLLRRAACRGRYHGLSAICWWCWCARKHIPVLSP